MKAMKTELINHIEKVKHFQTVAEAGTIQLASKKIGIAQPALSKSIKILEEAIGCELFERSRKGTFLTPEGKSFLKFSYDMNDLIRNIESEIFHQNSQVSGLLSIGMHELYVPFLWPQILNLFKKEAPELKLKLVTDVSSRTLLDQLDSRNLDVVIAIDSEVSASFEKIFFYEDEYSFYQAITSSKSSNKTHEIFYLPDSVIDQKTKLRDLMRKNSKQLKSPHSVSSYASVLSLTLSGVGIGILPNKPASFYTKKKVIKKYTHNQLKQKKHKVFVYTRKSSEKSRSINFFKKNMLDLKNSL